MSVMMTSRSSAFCLPKTLLFAFPTPCMSSHVLTSWQENHYMLVTNKKTSVESKWGQGSSSLPRLTCLTLSCRGHFSQNWAQEGTPSQDFRSSPQVLPPPSSPFSFVSRRPRVTLLISFCPVLTAVVEKIQMERSITCQTVNLSLRSSTLRKNIPRHVFPVSVTPARRAS